MQGLIIYAHPKTKGHCPLILQEVKIYLTNQKILFDVLDLYATNYDPILHENEHYTAGNRDIDGLNQELQQCIQKADLLIFIYPVWWWSMPAILKGFIDRVLTPYFAFRYEGRMPKGMLADKQGIVFMTSAGPKIYYRLTGNVPKKLIKKGVLEFCGIKTKIYQLFGCTEMQDDTPAKIKKLVHKAFRIC